MSRLPEQDVAQSGTYEALDKFLNKQGGLSILNPKSDHCAFIMQCATGISVSLHNLRREGRIRLVRVDPDNSIARSIPAQPNSTQLEIIPPRRNLNDILQGIGQLIDQAGTTIKPIP